MNFNYQPDILYLSYDTPLTFLFIVKELISLSLVL